MELSAEILALRPYLFRIAYNMLGVAADAEDIVHDVFEKWISVEQARDPKAYLARMTINRSIKRLEEVKALRENYTGPWLPEPLITFEPDPAPTIEYGLLFLLERLNPAERAVFILRESFSEEYSHIAELTGMTEENCRQLLHRAHEKLRRTTTRPVDPERHRALTEAFLFSLAQQDRSSLEHLLRNDIELYSDGGGKRAAALRPLFGFEKVLKFLFGVKQLPDGKPELFGFRHVFVNGAPGMLLFRKDSGEWDSLVYVEADEQQIARLLYMRNPDKLRGREE